MNLANLRAIPARVSLVVIVALATISTTAFLSRARADGPVTGSGYLTCRPSANPCPQCPPGGGGTYCISALGGGTVFGACVSPATNTYCTSGSQQCGATISCTTGQQVLGFCTSGVSWGTCQ